MTSPTPRTVSPEAAACVAAYKAHIAARGQVRTLLVTGGPGAGKATVAQMIAPNVEPLTGRLTDAGWRKHATGGAPVIVVHADDVTGLTISQIMHASQPGFGWRTLGANDQAQQVTASVVIIISREPIDLAGDATSRIDHLHINPTDGDNYTPATRR